MFISYLVYPILIACTGPIGPIEPTGFIEPQNIRKAGHGKEKNQSGCFEFMTYNIRVGGGTENPFTPVRYISSSKENLERIAFAIESVDPEVVALQEVRGFHQVKFLAEMLNFNYAYSPHGRQNLDWGLALLSKFRILEASSKVIHHGGDQRVGAAYTIDINGNSMTLINVHYHVGNFEPQVKATMALLKATRGPVVLMGDFNRPEAAYELKPIRQTMIDTCNAVNNDKSRHVRMTGTYLGWPHRRIDYVFIDPKCFEVKDVGILPEKNWHASDHIAYFACITLKTPQRDYCE